MAGGARAGRNAAASLDEIAIAVERGSLRLRERQEASGRFPDTVNVGPAYTAYPIIALLYAGVPLPPAETAAVVTWLRAEQRADGSYVPYPFATSGDLASTAAVWAALRAVGLPEDDPTVAAAARFVGDHGGLAAVVRELYEHTNFAAVFIAMAGFISPAELPLPPPSFVLLPPVRAFLEKRFDCVNVVASMVAVGAVVEDLRLVAARREAALQAASPAFLDRAAGEVATAGIAMTEAVESLERGPVLAFLAELQNPNGSFDDTTLQTALLVAAYHALGLGPDHPSVARAATWIRDMLVPAPVGCFLSCFSGDVWTSSFALGALLRSGVPRTDPAVIGAVTWLLDAQIEGNAAAAGSGGWAFEGGNVKLPDCDDTGVVLAALALAAARDGEDALPSELASRIIVAVSRAGAWLERMQNQDGGWSAFQTWKETKPRGPIMTEQLGLVGRDAGETLERILHPPIALGSPSWEDVTARVLFGLGRSGYTTASPVVARAIAFLRSQQCDEGPWWGRWMINYLPTTAWALMGLSAVGADLNEPWIARATAWVISRQNEDGGWGESELTYARPDLAGRGPSMAPLTGVVISGLIAAGRGASIEVARGVAYLVRQQRPDGTWPNDGWLHAFFPPQSFYHYASMPYLYPLEAIAAHLAEQRGRSGGASPPAIATSGARTADGRWSDAFLEAARGEGDPEADALAADLLAAGGVEAVNAALAAIVRSDDPVPAGLPEPLRAYVERPAILPSFADPARIAVAQQLFARAGWSIALGLFCSALPQAYAAAKGAKVLVYTGRMQTDVRRRILETAQLVFDVADEGSFSEGGRGFASVRKVRLVHAAVRALVARQPSWDPADGVPINQEDLAATLMTFSCVILDALARLGIPTSAEEREAWLHLWTIVGALLGIRPELLPRDVADADALAFAIHRRQWAPSPQGRALTAALVASINEYLPGHALSNLPNVLIRHVAGDRCADVLGVPGPDWTAMIADAGAAIFRGIEQPSRDAGVAALTALVNARMAEALVSVQRIGKGAAFRIPASLRGSLPIE